MLWCAAENEDFRINAGIQYSLTVQQVFMICRDVSYIKFENISNLPLIYFFIYLFIQNTLQAQQGIV